MAARPDPPSPPPVRAVLVAEFDIDKGSVVRVQHPAPLAAAPDALAELMLPEGAHNHEADWTYFAVRPMLNRSPRADRPFEVRLYEYRAAGGGEAAAPDTAAEGEWTPRGDEPLSLSLEVGGGGGGGAGSRALVLRAGRAEALRVPLHPELQYTLLQPDFISAFGEDGRALGMRFRSAEEQLAFSELLAEAMPEWDDLEAAPHPGGAHADAEPSGMLWCINLVCTRKDRSIRRGAEVKAVGVVSALRQLHVFKPLLVLAMDKLLAASAEAHASQAAAAAAASAQTAPQPGADAGGDGGGAPCSEAAEPTCARAPSGAAQPADGGGGGTWRAAARDVAAQLYDALLAIDFASVPRPSAAHAQSVRLLTAAGSLAPPMPPAHALTALWDGRPVPLSMPLLSAPEELADARASLIVSTFGPATGAILRALLAGQRLLFISQTQRAAEVCAHVLAAPLLVSPPLEGVLSRCHPYANLTALAFLSCPGFVAGVTNPMFAARRDWWDLLCDIDSGAVTHAAGGGGGAHGGGGGLGAAERGAASRATPPSRPTCEQDSGGSRSGLLTSTMLAAAGSALSRTARAARAAGSAAAGASGAGSEAAASPRARGPARASADGAPNAGEEGGAGRAAGGAAGWADDGAFAHALCAGVAAGLSEAWVREMCRERVRALIATAAVAVRAGGGLQGATAARAMQQAARTARSAEARAVLLCAASNPALSRAVRAALAPDASAAAEVRLAVTRLTHGARDARALALGAPEHGARALGTPARGASDEAGAELGAELGATPGGAAGGGAGVLSAGEACDLLSVLLGAASDERLLPELLRALDATVPSGALAPVATMLLHTSPEVRALTARVLQRLEASPDARPCVQALNAFFAVAYEMQLRLGS